VRAGAGPRPWARALAVCAAVVGLDQALKAAVIASLAPGESIHLGLGFELTIVTNRGLAFGALGGGAAAVVVLATVALAAVVVWFALDSRRRGLWLGVGLLAGGALGNLADRARDGFVTDFVDPPLWPAFNLADVAITAGAVILVLLTLGVGEASRE
jgi:signal peptidase II